MQTKYKLIKLHIGQVRKMNPSHTSRHITQTHMYIARELCSAQRRVPCNQQATVKFFDRYNALKQVGGDSKRLRR